MRRAVVLAWLVAAGSIAATASLAQEGKPKDRETRVREDRRRVVEAGDWIYDDLPKGLETARSTGKPLLVVFRCIPCDACSQIDERVLEADPAIRELLGKFVRVRIPNANGMDLGQFQFDMDLSWAAFLMDADGTIYGRYGTRSHATDSERDMSVEGLAKAMAGALELHAQGPKGAAALSAKRGAPQQRARPQDYPTLAAYAPTLDWEGKVVKSCIHCHQVGEAMRRVRRDAKEPMPREVLFPYPNPRAVGLDLDPKERARVRSVTAGSPAEKAGFRAGDDITTALGQRILSIADVQWVLHGFADTAAIVVEVTREAKPVTLELHLGTGWRAKDDISWRSTTWDLRRMATGGMKLDEMSDADRRAAGIADGKLALFARHLGEYGEHAAAKNAGFRKGDVLVSVDGRDAAMRETDLIAHLLARTKPGDSVAVTVLRDGNRIELKLPMQ